VDLDGMTFSQVLSVVKNKRSGKAFRVTRKPGNFAPFPIWRKRSFKAS